MSGVPGEFADLPPEMRTPGYAAGLRAAARLVDASAGGGFGGITVDRDLDVCTELVHRLTVLADAVDEFILTDTEGRPVSWEYGIRRIGDRSARIHRTNMSEDEARRFMSPHAWAPLPVDKVFEIVRRARGDDWQKVDL